MAYVPVDPGGGYVNYYTKFRNVVVNGNSISFQIYNFANPTTYYQVNLMQGTTYAWTWTGTVAANTVSSTITIPTSNVAYNTTYGLYLITPSGASSPIV